MNNANSLRITAAAGTKLAGISPLVTVIILTNEIVLQPIWWQCHQIFSAVLTNAILLDPAFAYCPIFPTAGICLGLISVPVWLIILSNQLKIKGMVSFYPTIYHNLAQAHLIANYLNNPFANGYLEFVWFKFW